MQYIDVIIKLRKIIRSINLESKQIEKQFGISIPQLLTLQFLSVKEDYKAKATDIKGYLNLNASTVTGIIKRLEGKGLVAKLPSPKDRRSTFITLTAKGFDLLKESPETLQQKLEKRLKSLPEDKIIALQNNIDLLVRILDASDIEASPLIMNGDISK